MTERDRICASIVEIIADYRQCDLTPPTPEHVNYRVKQSDNSAQLSILQEKERILKKTYFSR